MPRRKLELSATQLVATVAATATGALAASKLGTAGTIMGAAITSAVATGGSAVYKHFLDHGKERIAGPEVPAVTADVTRLDLPAVEEERLPWNRRWYTYLAVAVASFALVVGGIALVETLRGEPLVKPNNQSGDSGKQQKPDVVPTKDQKRVSPVPTPSNKPVPPSVTPTRPPTTPPTTPSTPSTTPTPTQSESAPPVQKESPSPETSQQDVPQP